jgi:exodeoxyribonuclease III
MRIVTWNVNGGFERKWAALRALQPDIAVVQEIRKQALDAATADGCNALWWGGKDKKGIAVIATPPFRITCRERPAGTWLVGVEVQGPRQFRLIPVWACAVGTRPSANYVAQTYRALNARPRWLKDGPVVLAGDFNSNAIWDKNRRVGNHSQVVRMLAEAGVVSAYHAHAAEEHGAESCNTQYLYRHADRGYHLDYVFVPKTWTVTRVEIGSHADWCGLSDHCPVMVEVE